MRQLVLDITKWETPATHYTEEQVNNYRLHKKSFNNGYFPHYCIDGYVYSHILEPIDIMHLQEHRNGKWHDWMADVPMDCACMGKYAEQAYGKVLVGGLGLCLLPHELVKNPAVTDITVVELSQDVINLTGKYLPEGVKLVHQDLHEFINNDSSSWDWLIIDIWATVGKEQHTQVLRDEVIPFNNMVRTKYPDAKIVIHGFSLVSDINVVQGFYDVKDK